jgi:hypothetical protein
MTTLRKTVRHAAWLWLLLPIVVSGCRSYISKEAQGSFESREGSFTVTVYPVNVVRGATVAHDEALARRVIAFLQQENLAGPVLGPVAAEIPVKWGANQAKMAQQSAIAFASQVKGDGIQTDYALLAEILCDANETRVLGVHFFLSDPAGLLVNGGLTNSHWEDFKEVRPHDRQGGYEVVVRMLGRKWKRN